MRNLPEKLTTYYYRHLVDGFRFPLIAWTITLAISQLGFYLWLPMTQRMFVGLFEATRPENMTFLQFAMPTILFIALSWIFIDICAITRDFAERVWKVGIRHKNSITLNKYVHGQSMSFWEGRLSGKVNSQFTVVYDGFVSSAGVVKIGIQLLVILSSVGMLLTANNYITFVVFGVLSLRMIYSAFLIFPMEKAAEAASNAGTTLSGKITDSIANYSLVKMFGSGDTEERYLNIYRRKLIRDTAKSLFIQRLFWAIPSVIWDIMFAVVMIMCISLYSQGVMKLSDVVFSIAIYFSIMTAFSNMMGDVPGVIEGVGASIKSYSSLHAPVKITDAPGAVPLKISGGAIEFYHVSFEYNDKTVLKDLNLKIAPGERIGIVGESGAGKTTLTALLLRMYDPIKGRIMIDGQDIKTVAQESLRKNIAIVQQDPAMFNRSIRDNIAYGKPGATMDEVRAAARLAGADDFIMKAEKGYGTIVGEHGIKLSGGQKQRIAIARAFLKDAPILILDEATSALDSDTESIISSSLNDICRSKTVIVIAHRLSTLADIDRIIVIDDGRIVDIGTHKELISRPGKYQNLWRMQYEG